MHPNSIRPVSHTGTWPMSVPSWLQFPLCTMASWRRLRCRGCSPLPYNFPRLLLRIPKGQVRRVLGSHRDSEVPQHPAAQNQFTPHLKGAQPLDSWELKWV